MNRVNLESVRHAADSMNRAIGKSRSQRWPIVLKLPSVRRSQTPPRQAGRQPGRTIHRKLRRFEAAAQPQSKPDFIFGSGRIGKGDVNRTTLRQPAACADGEEHLLGLEFL